MYRKVPTDMKFVEREKETLRLWKEKGIIEKCFHCRDGAERFTFFDGPPTANGRPHIGHIETRAIKDLIPRYQNDNAGITWKPGTLEESVKEEILAAVKEKM